MFAKVFLAAAAILFSVAANAATLTMFVVTGNSPTSFGPAFVADTGTVIGTFGAGDSLDAHVISNALDLDGEFDINFAPSPLKSIVEVSLTDTDISIFGAITISLLDAADTVLGTATAAAGGTYAFFGISTPSPLTVRYAWENAVSGGFNSDISLAAIPLPATALLLVAGLGGIAATRRRKS